MPFADAALLSFDSLVAGCAVAPLLSRTSHRLAAAGLFGAADALGSSLGALVGAAPIAPALYGAYLVAAIGLAGHALHASRASTLVVLGALAAALSIDNLAAAGPALEASAVVAMGCASAAAMLLGLAAGARIFRALSSTPRGAWVGAGLVAVALLGVVA